MIISMTFRRGDRGIELGGGDSPLVRPNVDVRPCFDQAGNPTVSFVADFEDPLPIKDADFDFVLCRYCLEHLSFRKVPQFLAEVYRILTPGGSAVFTVPDTEEQIRWIREHPDGWDGLSPYEAASNVLYGGQDYPENTHKAYYSKGIVRDLFLAAKFARVEVTPFGERGTDMAILAVKDGDVPVLEGADAEPVTIPIGIVPEMAPPKEVSHAAGTEVVPNVLGSRVEHVPPPQEFGFVDSVTTIPRDPTGGTSQTAPDFVVQGWDHRVPEVVVRDPAAVVKDECFVFTPSSGRISPMGEAMIGAPADETPAPPFEDGVTDIVNLPPLTEEQKRVLGAEAAVIALSSPARVLGVLASPVSAGGGVQIPAGAVVTVGGEPRHGLTDKEREEVREYISKKYPGAAQSGEVSVVHVEKPPEKPKREGPGNDELFDRDYFNGGGKFGGYSREGYWDYPVHHVTAKHVLDRRPQSVLEIGCARGYVLKRILSAGIPGVGLEISDHCLMTSAAFGHVLKCDLGREKFPIGDVKDLYDLAYSVATLEHIPEEDLPLLLMELRRTSKRGLHGIDFGEHDDGFDKTHRTLKPFAWWRNLFDTYGLQSHEIVDKEELERGDVPAHVLSGDGKLKLNLGSFTTMYHYGWVNADALDLARFAAMHGYKFRQFDVRKGLPFATGSVDAICMQHLLDQLTYAEAADLLRECRRVLNPDTGGMRIAVPSDMPLRVLYDEGCSHVRVRDHYRHVHPGVATALTDFQAACILVAESHRSWYDDETLHTMLKEAGFKSCRAYPLRGFVDGNRLHSATLDQIVAETHDVLPALSIYAEAVPEVC